MLLEAAPAVATVEEIDEATAEFIATFGDRPVTIDSLSMLEWYGRKLTADDDQIARIQANADELIAGLKKHKQGLQERFGVQAENFVMATLQATNAKTKTLKTLGGSFAFRLVPGGIRKTDEAALIEWAKANAPRIVTETVKHSVASADLKQYFIENGEIPPGAEYVEDRQSFSHKAGV